VKSIDLSFGMLLHEVSVLLVIVNAVRLLAYGGGDSTEGASKRSILRPWTTLAPIAKKLVA
jgi:Cd2+/Zn2+-exporting ATPase